MSQVMERESAEGAPPTAPESRWDKAFALVEKAKQEGTRLNLTADEFKNLEGPG